MADTKFRVKAHCTECGRIWTTKAKDDKKAPRICRGKAGCGSTKTRKIKHYKVKV